MKDKASYVYDSCGEEIVLPIDLSAGSVQECVEDYIEDGLGDAVGDFHERFLRLAVVLIDEWISGRVQESPCILEVERYNQLLR